MLMRWLSDFGWTVLLLATGGWVLVDAFLVLRQQQQVLSPFLHKNYNNNNAKGGRTIPFWAKPPPSAGFDLEAIEAFESFLLEQEEEEEDDDDDDLMKQDETLSIRIIANDTRTYEIPAELHKKRIDAAIVELLLKDTTSTTRSTTFETQVPSRSRSFCGNLVTDGCVYLIVDKDSDDDNMQKRKMIDRKSFKVSTGQTIQVQIPLVDDSMMTEIVAQDLPLDILFEDEHMIVLNKAANMVVHPAAGNWEGTVVNALAYYLRHKSPYGGGDYFVPKDELNINNNDYGNPFNSNDDVRTSFLRPGIVHRLDKGTTGVLVVAKTAPALAALSDAFATRRVKKTYLAVTVGNPGKRVVIDKPIGRHPVHRQRMRVVPDPHSKDSSGMTPTDRMMMMKKNNNNSTTTTAKGRRAISFVDTIAFDGKLSLVRVRIATGRTHQIRVHLQDRRTPIYGDDVYGLSDWNKRLSKTHKIERPLLHAFRLELEHPVTGEMLVFQAPLAEDMQRIAKAIYPDGEEELPEIFCTTKDPNE